MGCSVLRSGDDLPSLHRPNLHPSGKREAASSICLHSERSGLTWVLTQLLLHPCYACVPETASHAESIRTKPSTSISTFIMIS